MRDMQGASDTPVRMTCRACVHNIVHAIVSAKLQTIIIIAKRTKHRVFCSFERIFQGQKHKIRGFCAFESGAGGRGLEFEPADGLVAAPVGELALGIAAGIALDKLHGALQRGYRTVTRRGRAPTFS